MKALRYEAAGWGVGELVLEGERLLYHDLPRPRRSDGRVHLHHSLVERLRAYFGGSREDFSDVELDLDWCTPFQRGVLAAMRRILYGEVATYGEVAALAGHPNAQRAVGSVCAQNRFALIVPCHRVVSASGIGPYGSLGSEYKQRLLALEGVAV